MAKNKIINFKINKTLIKQKIAKSNKYKQLTDGIAKKKTKEAKRDLLKDFESHPVTMEIASGESGENISGTLGGYGNLFTFIGFSNSSNPTVAVRNFLISAIKMKKASRGGNLNVNYNISVPTLDDFNLVAKMPWEGGNNWVKGVETGISGFSYFMSKASQASRSGSGIQINNKLRSIAKSADVKYISKILKDFKKRIIRK